MADLRLFGSTSNLIRFVLKNSTTGQGLTGLSSASSGLIISTIADVESSATAYTVAGSTIETITTLGTYATPTATKCRFKEVDATNHPGLYEFQFADARFAVSNAKRLIISVSGAASLLNADYEIEQVQFNPFDSVRLGLTALPNAAAEAAGGLYTRGTGAGQINQDANGRIDVNAKAYAGTTITAPATAGIPDVNAKAINNVATTSVTTINANVGTTQPLNFTGTAASALVKSDMVDIAGAAVSATTAQIGVNVVNFGGSAGTFSSGKPAVILAATDVTGNVAADVQTIKTQAVTCAAGVAVGAFVGNATAALAVDASGRVDLGKILGTASAGAVGYVGIDWGHINAPTTAQNLSGTTISTTQAVASVSGAVGSVVGLTASNLDTTVSSRLAASSYTAPLDASGTRSAVGMASANLDTQLAALDADILTRLAAASYTAPDNTTIGTISSKIGTPAVTVSGDIAAVNAKTTNLPASPAAVGSAMTLDLTQAVPTSNTANTVGDALNGARAQAFGKWVVSGTTLTLYAPDGTTAVRTFTLDSAASPTSRT